MALTISSILLDSLSLRVIHPTGLHSSAIVDTGLVSHGLNFYKS
nr:MAG TPA: hypothetical protein [Caudoviricetes sp.]